MNSIFYDIDKAIDNADSIHIKNDLLALEKNLKAGKSVDSAAHRLLRYNNRKVNRLFRKHHQVLLEIPMC